MTIAIFMATPDGLARVATMRTKQTTDRGISDAFMAKHRGTDHSMFYFSRRRKVMGRWIDDSKRVPMDPTIDENGFCFGRKVDR